MTLRQNPAPATNAGVKTLRQNFAQEPCAKTLRKKPTPDFL